MSVLRIPEAIDPSADLQIFGNPKASFDSVSDKENVGWEESNQIPIEEKSRTDRFPTKGSDEKMVALDEFRDEKKIDDEIKEIESQIMKLKSRLEALRLEKAEMNMKALDFKKTGAEPKSQKRGISLGPVEIMSGARKGTLVGPTEIFGLARRKSCFWKLQDINEEKSISRETSKKGFSSMSPKSRRAVTTISTRKTSKKDDSVLNSVQPKKLFGEGENTGFAVGFVASKKKPSRPGRVVASRQKCDAKRALPENSRVKRRWEIPSEIVVHGSLNIEKSPPPSSIVLLPKIKIARFVKESPRDSGPDKKVAELIGRKSFFAKKYERWTRPFVKLLLMLKRMKKLRKMMGNSRGLFVSDF
ncbi:hypothetical protein STAS_07638 [Striga asiatica]|uniref:Uncharacterized protein n=1 Tax=Striga asiatica TaxID=4170 RepID=A0A5A7PFS3_STRAF|nr:hypothetical protein STAS_07638 [Striga asiatica]